MSGHRDHCEGLPFGVHAIKRDCSPFVDRFRKEKTRPATFTAVRVFVRFVTNTFSGAVADQPEDEDHGSGQARQPDGQPIDEEPACRGGSIVGVGIFGVEALERPALQV